MIANECGHENFSANVEVIRLTNGDTSEAIGYSAELSIRCSNCGKRFCFSGLPIGFDLFNPTASASLTTGRFAIYPEGSPTDIFGVLSRKDEIDAAYHDSMRKSLGGGDSDG